MVRYDQSWIAIPRLRRLDINFVSLIVGSSFFVRFEANKEGIGSAIHGSLYILLIVWHFTTGTRGSKICIGSRWFKISGRR